MLHMKLVTISVSVLVAGIVYIMFLFMEDAVAVAGAYLCASIARKPMPPGHLGMP
jgi:hypothetical protein